MASVNKAMLIGRVTQWITRPTSEILSQTLQHLMCGALHARDASG